MARGGRTIDRDPEKPPPEESGAWTKRGSKTIDRVVEWLLRSDSAVSENCEGSPAARRIDRDPEKPPPEESGAWTKRGSKTIDRIVEWLVRK